MSLGSEAPTDSSSSTAPESLLDRISDCIAVHTTDSAIVLPTFLFSFIITLTKTEYNSLPLLVAGLLSFCWTAQVVIKAMWLIKETDPSGTTSNSMQLSSSWVSVTEHLLIWRHATSFNSTTKYWQSRSAKRSPFAPPPFLPSSIDQPIVSLHAPRTDTDTQYPTNPRKLTASATTLRASALEVLEPSMPWAINKLQICCLLEGNTT